jgi:hypothetical protein
MAILLSKLYTRRAELTADKHDLAQDLETRKLMLTPNEGWPGKNAEARDIARDLAYSADVELQDFSTQVASIEHDLTILGGDIDAAEADRRAEEWAVRARYVAVREREAGVPPGDEMLDTPTAPEYFDIDF